MDYINMANKTPQEVAAAIRADFRAQNLTMKDAAALLGISPAALSAVLSRGSYLGRVTANKLVNKFGYDISFLYTGAGTLRTTDTPATAGSTPFAVDLQLRQILSICVSLQAAVGSIQRQVAELRERAGCDRNIG